MLKDYKEELRRMAFFAILSSFLMQDTNVTRREEEA